MDKTETYIKMSDCPEMQEGWQPSVGDWFLHDWHGTTKMGKEAEDKIWPEKEKWERIECLVYKPSISDFISITEEDGTTGVYTSSELLKNRHIWLPTQSQLQEMVLKETKLEPWRLNVVFMDWQQNEFDYDEHGSPRWKHGPYHTMEQLWLAFVMKEKYNKAWNGEKWIKQS